MPLWESTLQYGAGLWAAESYIGTQTAGVRSLTMSEREDMVCQNTARSAWRESIRSAETLAPPRHPSQSSSTTSDVSRRMSLKNRLEPVTR